MPDRYLLFQILNKKVAYTGEQVVACIAAKNAMVTVGVNLHVKLLVGLYQCFTVFGSIPQMYIVIGRTVNQ